MLLNHHCGSPVGTPNGKKKKEYIEDRYKKDKKI